MAHTSLGFMVYKITTLVLRLHIIYHKSQATTSFLLHIGQSSVIPVKELYTQSYILCTKCKGQIVKILLLQSTIDNVQ